jgi:polyisoprenoid-binding protein YceI
MTRTMDSRKFLVLAAALFAALLTLSSVAAAAEPQDVAAAVRAKLDKSQYKDVQVNVDANGVATLTGTVNLYDTSSMPTRMCTR